jgi:hypothetical protein
MKIGTQTEIETAKPSVVAGLGLRDHILKIEMGLLSEHLDDIIPLSFNIE